MSVAASLVFFGLETKVKWSYMKLKFKTKCQKWKQSMKKILTLFFFKKGVDSATK